MSKLEVGVIVPLTEEPAERIKSVAQLGLRWCQVYSWNLEVWTDRTGEGLTEALEKYGVSVSTFWSGYPGPRVWDFLKGPSTIGLVPSAYRRMRTEVLKKAADFAAKFKLPQIATHVGFLPEDPNDSNYVDTVEAVKEVARRCSGSYRKVHPRRPCQCQGRLSSLNRKLKSIGYAGTLTIEREIEGPRQITGIKASIELLRPLC